MIDRKNRRTDLALEAHELIREQQVLREPAREEEPLELM
jgi:hypothetical protein